MTPVSMTSHARRRGPTAGLRRLAVLFDPPEENWPSMDLVGEMLVRELCAAHADELAVTAIRPNIRAVARTLRPVIGDRVAFRAERAIARFVEYPARAAAVRGRFDAFHVVDHSYAQLVHALPRGRAGVFCHDIDAFRCLVTPATAPRPAWFRAMARATLEGLRRAAVVFHSTLAVRREIEAHGLVDPSVLAHVPYGVAPEFYSDGDADDRSDAVLCTLGGRPFVLHVGSTIPRKRMDVLFAVFAAVRARVPELVLVQQGGTFGPEHRAQLETLGIASSVVQPPNQNRATLAGLYRRAAALLVPSEAEGFGLPVIEALASGTTVVASDIPALREAGGDAALYCPVGDVPGWAAAVVRVLDHPATAPSPATRRAWARRFTWSAHADGIITQYRRRGLLDTS